MVYDIQFQGDPQRYLIPARTNITIPESTDPSSNDLVTWIIVIIAAAAVVGLATAGVMLLNRMRRDTGSRRVEEARTTTLYPFKPREGAQEMIYKSYRNVLDELSEKGIGRPPEMTPDEFDEAVRTSTGNGDLKRMEEITRLFDEARYSDHDLSSHLITKARTIDNELRKEITTLEDEGLKERFDKARAEMVEPVRRPLMWKMRIDHEEDLKDLIGKKGGLS
jgi:hypothetical protein